MSWIEDNWKPLTVVGGLLGISWFAGKKFEEAENFDADEEEEEGSETGDCRVCYGTGGLYDSRLGIDDACANCDGTGYMDAETFEARTRARPIKKYEWFMGLDYLKRRNAELPRYARKPIPENLITKEEARKILETTKKPIKIREGRNVPLYVGKSVIGPNKITKADRKKALDFFDDKNRRFAGVSFDEYEDYIFLNGTFWSDMRAENFEAEETSYDVMKGKRETYPEFANYLHISIPTYGEAEAIAKHYRKKLKTDEAIFIVEETFDDETFEGDTTLLRIIDSPKEAETFEGESYRQTWALERGYYVPDKTQKQYEAETKRFKKIARKYGFKAYFMGDAGKEDLPNQVVLEAKNTDGEWNTWFTINLDTGKLRLRGNTDHSNLWFYETRKDMTPRKLVRFVKEINAFITSVKPHILMRHLIDPEDYQEIANINDAYDDDRYFMGAESFRVGDEGMFEGGEVRITSIEDNSEDGRQNVYFFTYLDEEGNSDGFIHTSGERKFMNQFAMFPREMDAETFNAEDKKMIAFRYSDKSPAHICEGYGYTNTTQCGKPVNWDKIKYPFKLTAQKLMKSSAQLIRRE